MESVCFNNDKQLKECDLVMKGGITSGIVYPPIVLKLAHEYRFRSIGGTSAGAIAAAITAAAEYGRKSGGFLRLIETSEALTEEGFLLNLFQPTPTTQPLMDTLYTFFIDKGNKGEKKLQSNQSTIKKHTFHKLRKASIQNSASFNSNSNIPRSPLAKLIAFAKAAHRLHHVLEDKHPNIFIKGSRRGIILGLVLALIISGISFLIFFCLLK